MSLRVRLFAAALAVCAGVARPVAAATPREVIQQLADQALRILDDKNASTETKRHELEDLVSPHVDWDTVTRLVLARNLSRFSPAQKEEFTKLFREHLSLTYGRSIESYNNDRVVITSDRQESDGDWTVKSKILRTGGDEVMLDYRLRKEGDEWKIIDIVP